MDLKKKAVKIGILFISLLIVSGVLLLYKGNDAVAVAISKKEGILTAEQVKLAFDSVGGRMVNEAVKEADEVKKGDVIMVLDSTDVDLSIEKLSAQIDQMDAQINSLNGTINVGFARTDTSEVQSYRQIDQQRAAVDSARASYANKQLDYNRKSELAKTGAIAISELDDARMALDMARANTAQQEELLAKLLAGVNDTGATDTLRLPSIEQEREDLRNKQYDVESLKQQKRLLETTLKELQVQKERLTLRAPEDGKILKILAKQGEMISPNTPVVLLESKRYYYDIYVSEEQAAKMGEGAQITGTTIATDKKAVGTVRFITAAPGFADLKMSRERGQADLASFQVRIYTEPMEGLLPGMTIEVNEDEFLKK
jgi:HlyD family secretion protein